MTNSIQILGPRGNTLSVTATGSGPTLFLLHGFPLDQRLWDSQWSSLGQSHHVVAVHLRGFGNSTLDDASYTLADLAEDVEFLRRHLAGEEAIWLAGLSMGGYVAFEYWRLFPSRLKGLILTNTKPTADDEAAQQSRLAMGQKALEQGTWSAVEPLFAKMLSGQTQASRPEIVRLVKEMMQNVPPASIAAAQSAMAQRRDFTPMLPGIHLRTLVVAGQDDTIAPPEATRQWAQQIPGSQFEIIPASAHLSPLEAPDQFNQMVFKFLLG